MAGSFQIGTSTSDAVYAVLHAMSLGQDDEAMVLLVSLVECEPQNAYLHYLLGALHAQLGMMEQAEAGFRMASLLAPSFQIARFQLGHLLLVMGRTEEAVIEFAPLLQPTLLTYANGLMAAAAGEIPTAIFVLQSGLELPQDNTSLADNMRRLIAKWHAGLADTAAAQGESMLSPGASMLLSNYGRLS
jgi:tetratricopeptide (TPR) repeat protein